MRWDKELEGNEKERVYFHLKTKAREEVKLRQDTTGFRYTPSFMLFVFNCLKWDLITAEHYWIIEKSVDNMSDPDIAEDYYFNKNDDDEIN